MEDTSRASFRLRLAEGFLGEARQDVDLQRWRSCVDNSQLLSVENAAKAVLAILGPVGRTHNPAPLIRQALDENAFNESDRVAVELIVEYAELLGPDIHVRSDYGDEAGGLTPWQLFDDTDANQALTWAEQAVMLARNLVTGSDDGATDMPGGEASP